MGAEADPLSGDVGAAQVRLFRFVFFALLALDLWLELVHAPRYGVGGFNVSHLPWLDAWLPMPDRVVLVATRLFGIWLAFRIAVGLGGRLENGLLAASYGLTYLWSQLDSYQHHYLLLLLLVILTPVRWSGPTPAWPFQLLRLQVGVVYLWATVAKLHPLWLDGTVLSRQVPAAAREQAVTVAAWLGSTPEALWQATAIAVVVFEGFLAVAVWAPRLRPWAVVPGVLLHLGIEWTGFKIGLFSWYMLGIYILVAPSGWLAWARLPTLPSRPPRWEYVVVAAIAGAGALAFVPLEGMGAATVVLTGVFALTEVTRGGGGAAGDPWRCATHALVCCGVLLLHGQTDVVRDHYKYLGGDARRRGDLPTALDAYERVVRLEPDYPTWRVRVADLHWRTGDKRRAADAYRAALALQPDDPAILSQLAHAFDALKLGEEALDAAERALVLRPDDERARGIRDRWRE